MKYRLLFLLFILTRLDVFCQNDSCYHFKVEYEMKLSFTGPTSYEANFYFNNIHSLFEYKENNVPEDSLENGRDPEPIFEIGPHDKILHYIKNNRERKMTTELVEGFRNNEFYEIEEAIPTINWIITEEQKKINMHDCIKATCSFRGRNYSVWFTTDIQTGFGPLKLNGLPGLILEVCDETKEVSLNAKLIKQEEKRIEYQPSGLKTITRSDYKMMLSEVMKKLEETAKIVTSRMDRGFKASVKFSNPKCLEMDYGF